MKELTLLCKQVLVCFSRLVVQAILEVEDKKISLSRKAALRFFSVKDHIWHIQK